MPQTATLIRSLAPIIFPEDFVPLIANAVKAEDWVRNFLRVSIIFLRLGVSSSNID
jgi:hypothetical protein